MKPLDKLWRSTILIIVVNGVLTPGGASRATGVDDLSQLPAGKKEDTVWISEDGRRVVDAFLLPDNERKCMAV